MIYNDKNPDDDNSEISPNARNYISLTVKDSAAPVHDDESHINHPQLNYNTLKPSFVPALTTPIIKCPPETWHIILQSLTEMERKILHYYIQGTPQIEVAKKLNMSTASHGRLLKSSKLKLGITGRNINEILSIMALVYNIKVPDRLVSKLMWWGFQNYGKESDVYKMLWAKSEQIWRARAEARKNLMSQSSQGKNETTNRPV